jgi:Fur family iron response transcriptional regulator
MQPAIAARYARYAPAQEALRRNPAFSAPARGDYNFRRTNSETDDLDLRERVTSRLVEHGVRPTAQRVEIAMRVLDGPCHFSAEQLLAHLRRSGVGISKATVYNTLALFCRQGLIREVAVDPARLMYDSTTRPHHHFYNEATGELTDISPTELRVSKLPTLPRATEAESIEVLIRVRPKAAE